ncbi:MAG: cupin domain-containing protein [Bryobacteraceae bacterium]
MDMEFNRTPTSGCILVKASGRVRAEAQTPGMIREEALNTGQLWTGIARTAPGNLSGWHHHGDWDTVAYVLSGAVRLECGPSGRTILYAELGDFLFIPRAEIHRESNPTSEEQRLVIVRSGHGPVVIAADAPENDAPQE